jgi:hypothetical protein
MPRKSLAFPLQALEFSIAAPQVLTHRLARLAFAGPAPSARDRIEFQRMGSEKAAAFYESWNAMLIHCLRVQQAMLLPWFASAGRVPNLTEPARQWIALWTHAMDGLAASAAPFHRRVVANAARLGRHGSRR